jgi:hypothetical protein
MPPELKVNYCKPLYNKDFDAASTFGQKFYRGRGHRLGHPGSRPQNPRDTG